MVENASMHQVELDLTGIVCPTNFVKAKIKLETMDAGSVLHLLVDAGSPIKNVPRAIAMEGHDILSVEKEGERYRVRVRKNNRA